ncbi:MAG: S1 RNA-binding domain-containing protein, partial [Alphaproteobacteria bacterium]|nr:S1 RNA-binding domain-containing protein [Alphaproteobacteria bacterium]
MVMDLLINVTREEYRTAVVEDGDPVDLIIEREGSSSLVGNIYLGRVVRLMPGMHAAFVDLGTDRSGFLPLSGPDDGQHSDPAEGEAVCVQVVRDPIGRKGAQLSRNL